ncbi:MAG: hypothetical protein QW508_00335 [Conexivisphaerales archaeon]
MINAESAHVDILELVDEARDSGISYIMMRVGEIQDMIVVQIARDGWKGTGPYMRTIITSIGTFRVIKLCKKGRMITPILDALGTMRLKYPREWRMMYADLASRMPYNE